MAEARSEGNDWFLGDAEEQHRAHPRSFFIPSRAERESLLPSPPTSRTWPLSTMSPSARTTSSFGDLVFSGAADGDRTPDAETGRYVPD
jgi:hypothetical protein